MKCPEGHPCGVRNTKFKGTCTPLYCCQVEKQVRPKKTLKELAEPDLLKVGQAVPDDAKVPPKDLHPRESEEFDEAKERKALAKLRTREQLRHEAIGFQGRGLQGADAEAWVSRRMVDLTPDAMAEIEWRLRNGNDAARADAARFILESQGHGKKDGPQIGQSPVLILTGIEVPWAKKVVKAAEKVVEAEVVPAQRVGPGPDTQGARRGTYSPPESIAPDDVDAS